MPKGVFDDLTGCTFGRLTVVSRAPNAGPATRWNCVCTCGKKVTPQGGALREGSAKSCGCFRSDSMKARQTTHGLFGTIRYAMWHGAKYRSRDRSIPFSIKV